MDDHRLTSEEVNDGFRAGFESIDLAKALGIILVVLGHYAPTTWHVGYWHSTVGFFYRFLSVLIERGLGDVRPLKWLGSRSFVVYLFHQPLAWAPAVVLYKLGFRGYELLWGLAPGVFLGLVLPALAYDLVIRRSRFLSLVVVGRAAVKNRAVSLSN